MTSPDPLSVDGVLAQSRTSGGCPICGSRSEGQVMVRFARLADGGRAVTGRGGTTARCVSLCGEHAAALWYLVSGAIDEARGGLL